MNKKLLALAVTAAVAAPTMAFADGVELYGILDVAVASVSNALSPDSNFSTGISMKGGSAITVTNTFNGILGGAIQASRWGIKGSEDLGDGLKAVFTLESGFQLPSGSLANNAQSLIDSKTSGVFGSNGSTNGELFNRTAWVGLADKDLGTVKFGKNYVFMYDVYNTYDPVQFAGLFSATGTSGTYGGGNGVSENLRQSNSVKYTNKNGDVNYGVMYKFGNQSGSTSAQSAFGLNVGYEHGNLGLQAVYQYATDGIKESAVNSTSIKLTAMNTSGYLLAAKYKFNQDLTGKLSYQRYNNTAPSDPLSTTGTATTTFNNLTVAIGSAGNVNFTGSQGVSILSVGGDYNIAPKLNLAVGYFSVNLDSLGTTAAIAETYTSALVDYTLSKRTDIYAGGMIVTTNAVNTSGQNIVAVGMRHKF